MMRIYLAAAYSRRLELAGYADQLRADGHEITAKWLTGIHEEPGWHEALYAADDFADVQRADCVLSFTEAPKTSRNRGGRHAEFGMGLAWGKLLILCGPREHCFHFLPQVRHFEGTAAEAFDQARRTLIEEALR
jgi:hypothetical protein